MDQKQIKASLKEAKEAIKNREIDKALRLCRHVLKADPENYLGLVILGAALQESKSRNEAPEAYRRAIGISPDQILAWQGLASYYEKEKLENVIHDLISTYKQLILLEKDGAKLTELSKKVDGSIRCVKDFKHIEEFASLLSAEDASKRAMVAGSLLKYFDGLKDVPSSLLDICEKVVLLKLGSQNEEEVTDCVQMYVKILKQKEDYKTILAQREKLLGGKNGSQEGTLELVCQAYCHLSLERDQCTVNDDIEKYCERLLKINSNSVYGRVARAIFLYDDGDYIESRDLLLKVSEVHSKNWLTWLCLSKVYLSLLCFEDALASISNAQNAIPKTVYAEMNRVLFRLKLIALARSGKVNQCKECLKLCSTLSPLDEGELFISQCEIHAVSVLSEDDIVENYQVSNFAWEDGDVFEDFGVSTPTVRHILYRLHKLARSPAIRDSAELTLLRGLCWSRFASDDEAVSFLQNELSGKEEKVFAECWILFGKLSWKRSNPEKALDVFLRAAKLAPHIYSSFLYLGHYYRIVADDWNKARRCYQKAFQLNPRDEEVGISLSDTYRALNLMEDNCRLLSDLTAAYGETWAWMRLGLHHLRAQNAESAVQCLRICIRNDSKNAYYWELLGDACSARGSFTAAIRSYQKCLDLDPSAFYARIQSALVKQKIGMFDESVQELRALVQEYPDCVPALKGLADACLSYVCELYDKQMLLSARDLCEEAAAALTKTLLQKNKQTYAWKLLADACIWVCRLPVRFAFLKLPSFLSDSKKERNVDDVETFSQHSLFDLAIRFYQTAIFLSADSGITASSLWHDIAFSYNLKASHLNSDDERIRVRKLAFLAAKKSTSLCPKEWQSWNLLGTIALSKEIDNCPLAQHCFIKTLQLDTNNAVAWHNLGTLYLQLEDIHLANEAFQAAQKADPKYSRSWIGQALIAETVGHDETIDLLYHTTVLGYHHESAKAFAEWICKILNGWDTYKEKTHCYYIVKKMYGLQVAVTVLSWYTVHKPDDIAAANMLAVLLELCDLNRTAASVLESVLPRVSGEECDVIAANLGRQLRKLGRYDKAIDCFKRVKQTDFDVQCEFALTLFLDGQYGEALGNYESAIHWLAPDDGWKAQVMVAVAALKYLRNEKKEAQAVLLQCAGLKPVPVYGLFAACAFGILNQELMLTKLVLKELDSFKHDEEHIQHVALFNSYYQIFQGNFKAAINTMSTFVHNHPGVASLWLSLCCLLLQLIFLSRKDYLKHCLATANHAECSITLGRGLIDISKISSIVSLSYSLAGRVGDGLRSSQKAVFTHPNVAENWAALIAVHSLRGKEERCSVSRMIKFVREKLHCTKALDSWLGNLETRFAAHS